MIYLSSVWRMGERGKMTLNDFDRTSDQDGNFVKMNTLKHYNVLNGSRMVLSLNTADQSVDENASKLIMFNNVICLSVKQVPLSNHFLSICLSHFSYAGLTFAKETLVRI